MFGVFSIKGTLCSWSLHASFQSQRTTNKGGLVNVLTRFSISDLFNFIFCIFPSNLFHSPFHWGGLRCLHFFFFNNKYVVYIILLYEQIYSSDILLCRYRFAEYGGCSTEYLTRCTIMDKKKGRPKFVILFVSEITITK